MLVVVEGIDGAGKSTLVDQLSHLAPDDAKVLHRGQPRDHPLIEYVWALTQYEVGGQTWICDRWHVGELIYGPIYRGHARLTPAMHRYVEMVLDRLGAIKILMDTPFDEVERRIARRGENFLQPQHRRLVWDAYHEQCTYARGWRSYTNRSKPQDVLTMAENAEADALKLDSFETYVGGRTPEVLLLGDRRGNPHPDRPRYPWAFVPYADTSGHYLLSAAEAAGAQFYGVANAWEEDVYALWRALSCPKIVLLGREAEKAVRRNVSDEVFHSSVVKVLQHPQYVRRFMNATMHNYGQAIREAGLA